MTNNSLTINAPALLKYLTGAVQYIPSGRWTEQTVREHDYAGGDSIQIETDDTRILYDLELNDASLNVILSTEVSVHTDRAGLAYVYGHNTATVDDRDSVVYINFPNRAVFLVWPCAGIRRTALAFFPLSDADYERLTAPVVGEETHGN